MRRWTRGLITGLVTAICGAGFSFLPQSLELDERTGLWSLFTIRGAIEPPREAVVVAIDENSGRALDLPKLPRDWPRTIHAQAVRSLVAGDAAVIVFDMDFNRPKEGEDIIFAGAIADAGQVVLYERLAARKQSIETAAGTTGGWTWVEQTLSPAPVLASSARGYGSFPLPKLGRAAFEYWVFKPSTGDAPTIVAVALQLYVMPLYEQWLRLLRNVGVPDLEAIPAHARGIEGAAELRRVMVKFRETFDDDATLMGRLQLAIDRDDELTKRGRQVLRALAALYGGPPIRYLNLYGPPGTIQRVPYQAVIAQERQTGTARHIDVDGKVAFIGYSDLADPEQPDRFYTVFTDRDGVDLSGVEIMASAFGNLLTDASIRPAPPIMSAGIVLLYGLAVGVMAYLLPAVIGLGITLTMSLGYASLALWSFTTENLWLPLATPFLVQLPIALLIGLTWQYLIERRSGRRMSQAISYYLPEGVVRDLTEKNLDPSTANKVVQGTCLATDMSGFTALAERKSPTELAAFMNTYFDALAAVLKRREVDITEFHADTIMCAWISTHAAVSARAKAALAAIDVMDAITNFATEDPSLRLNARIGLQDGQFYVGHTGGGGHLAYSILGDPANTASRLENLNKELGTHILAAESVVSDLTGRILFRPMGSFRLFGKAEVTPVVEILAQTTAATEDQRHLCECFSAALGLLRARRWDEAAALLESLLDKYPDDGPSRFYMDRYRLWSTKGAVPEEDLTIIHLDRK